MVKKVSARGLIALAVLLLWGSGVATAQSWKKERENRKKQPPFLWIKRSKAYSIMRNISALF